MKKNRLVSYALTFLTLSGCTKNCNGNKNEAESSSQTNEPAKVTAQFDPALVKKGKDVYQGSCIACHNTNPKMKGSLGPELLGSSLELVQARVMKAEYPAGYTPKTPTKIMVALPHLEKDIPALHAYLNSLN